MQMGATRGAGLPISEVAFRWGGLPQPQLRAHTRKLQVSWRKCFRRQTVSRMGAQGTRVVSKRGEMKPWGWGARHHG